MSTQTPIDRLVQQVEGFSLDALADKYPNCHPETNPFDFYRAHLSNVLADVTGVDPKIIYPSLSWTQSLDKGDLVLAAPALRVKGQKPDELVKQWAEKVSRTVGLRVRL
jgi:arginyl-tRNA synthetase